MSTIEPPPLIWAACLANWSKRPAGPPVPIPPDIGLEIEIALGRAINTTTLRKIGNPVDLSCPSSGGVLSEIETKPPLRCRCQVGHAFTADVLESGSSTPVDEALMLALRIIAEGATLADKMAADAGANGSSKERMVV